MAKGNQKRAGGRPRAQGLLERYRPIDGVVDEMVDASGNPRPAWRSFIEALDELGAETLGQRFARADQYLRDAGVYYRVYDKAGANEREWPLAHVPLLIDEKEWAEISAGLVQRADLFEAILTDVYGPNRLVEKGILPAGLIAASPEYLRPVVGVRPASGHFLHMVAFELGRGPDGRWWVLGDRTQAPSGAGFALENRVATTRALSDI
ncbi:circularly permuted type 2 ATP-grasp protein, partial [Mesorhizobium sp. M1E.F.Ca.ET.063.01.1.1]